MATLLEAQQRFAETQKNFTCTLHSVRKNLSTLTRGFGTFPRNLRNALKVRSGRTEAFIALREILSRKGC